MIDGLTAFCKRARRSKFERFLTVIGCPAGSKNAVTRSVLSDTMVEKSAAGRLACLRRRFMTVNEETLRSFYPDMVKWRRHMHRHPELSFKEFETSRMIADQLESWGLEVRRNVAGTGVIARLDGALPGRTIALRADIDALPIADEKDCAYASSVPGVMHACGHDAHTAQLLAVARYYSRHREETSGTRLFLFQPAEEFLPGGALGMIADGALDGVDAIYGVHVWSPLPTGVVAVRSGPFMACPDEFEVEVLGRGGHAGLPHQAVDALVTGAALVTALQTIVSRSVNPLDAAVVSVGRLTAGTANNVIAERCRLSGTVRTFTPEVRALVRRRLEEVVRHACELHGACFHRCFLHASRRQRHSKRPDYGGGGFLLLSAGKTRVLLFRWSRP
jgi:amidohydrolase